MAFSRAHHHKIKVRYHKIYLVTIQEALWNINFFQTVLKNTGLELIYNNNNNNACTVNHGDGLNPFEGTEQSLVYSLWRQRRI